MLLNTQTAPSAHPLYSQEQRYVALPVIAMAIELCEPPVSTVTAGLQVPDALTLSGCNAETDKRTKAIPATIMCTEAILMNPPFLTF
jgi:hypothetical protein